MPESNCGDTVASLKFSFCGKVVEKCVSNCASFNSNRRDASSASGFEDPDMQSCLGTYLWNLWWIPKRQRSWEVALLAVVLPLRCQNKVAWLSVLLRSVRSRVSKDLATTSKCSRPPTSSKSEFVIFLRGFAKVTKLSVMSFGHLIRHSVSGHATGG